MAIKLSNFRSGGDAPASVIAYPGATTSWALDNNNQVIFYAFSGTTIPTAGAVYTASSNTYSVTSAVASGSNWIITATRTGGSTAITDLLVLSKSSGTGDTSISCYAAYRERNGLIVANGALISTTNYPRLSTALSSTWNTCAVQVGIGGNYSAPGAGFVRIPDLRGIFLRGAGTSTKSGGTDSVTVSLATFSNDKTNKNGLALSGSAPSLSNATVASSGHTHGSSGMRAQITLRGGGNITMKSGSGGFTGDFERVDSGTLNGGSFSTSDSVQVSGSTDSPSGSTTVTISNGSYSLGTGDTESSPRYTGINYVVKM